MKRIIFIHAVFVTAVFLAGAQTPSEDAIFRQEGIASWYGAEFMGRPTASGEIFNPSLLTAAHPALPFGTLLRVTNTHNNKQVVVRINDRGPYVSSRIIDISRAAAEQLDMVSTGTAPVIVESLLPISIAGTAGALSQTLPASPASPAPYAGGSVVPQAPAAPYQPASTGPRTAPASAPAAPVRTPAPAPAGSPAATVPVGPPAATPVPVDPRPPAAAAPSAPASTPAAPVPAAPPVAAAPGTSPVRTTVPAADPTATAPAASPGPAFPSRPVTAPQSPRTKVSAAVLPSMPPMGTGKQYRVQVGAFRVARYASEAFDKLKNLGLNPAYEQYEGAYRVVIPGIRPEQIPALAEQLGTAGFAEILVREER